MFLRKTTRGFWEWVVKAGSFFAGDLLLGPAGFVQQRPRGAILEDVN